MAVVELMTKTQQFLQETLPAEQNMDAKVRQLIQAECLRELGRYRRVDMAFSRKYKMDFNEFIERQIVQDMGYSWEVEQDAMEWETAVGGILTMERKLGELRDLDNAPTV